MHDEVLARGRAVVEWNCGWVGAGDGVFETEDVELDIWFADDGF